MREIKFRAWIKEGAYDDGILPDGNEMDYIQGFVGETVWCSDNSEIDIKSCELMQFTGLKDKNGKEIYEGDIIKGDTYGHILEVIWDEGYCGFSPFLDLIDGDYTGEDWGRCEVIGNIYENPELLEDSK